MLSFPLYALIALANTHTSSTFNISALTPEACRASLSAFWSDITDIRTHDKGIAFSLPILLADGWQVTLYAEEEMPGYVTLRDRGKMSSWLIMHGVNLNSSGNRTIIDQYMADYGISTDAAGFYKILKLPFRVSEIQLFGCFLSALSHLINRVQKEAISRYL